MRIQNLTGIGAAVVATALSLALGACNHGDNANANANNSNANNYNANSYNGNSNTNTSSSSASEDTAIRNKVEANLSKYGVTGVTVEVSNGEVTLRGNIPRPKLQDAMKAANEANPKRVNNQMNIQ